MHKIGSLFDGSGGFPLAASLCGIEPTWASEVEPYPIAVTRSRFPNMVHLGSVTDVNGGEIEPCDVLTFGSPCQSLSVAGKREGIRHDTLGDEETTQSGLFMEAVRIIKEMREKTNGRYPTFAVWENVPGAFSSTGGADLRTVFEELIKIVEPTAVMPPIPKGGWAYADCYVGDGWSIAYRVFDAQYIRTAQRRRRIYLVLDLRGERAKEILFKRESLRGNPQTCGKTRQTASADAEGCSATDDREGASIAFHLTQDPISNDKVCPCLSSGNSDHGQSCIGICLEATGLDVYNQALTGDKSKCLNSAATDSDHIPCAIAVEPGIASREGGHIYEGVSGTLRANAGDNQMSVAYAVENHPADSRVNIDESGKVQTLTSRMGTGGGNVPLVMEKKHIISGGFKSNNSEKARSDGFAVELSPTLASGKHDASCVIALDRASFNQGENAKYDFEISESGVNSTLVAKGPGAVCLETFHLTTEEEKTHTLKARDYKDPLCVVCDTAPRYIVRRLTPTECARLQGFPDKWGHIDVKEDFTEEEYAFWLNVRKTDAEINGKQVKEWSKPQMVKWYNKLHTDSAEYKMWGNGIALPCALYVMEGIADALKEEKDEEC